MKPTLVLWLTGLSGSGKSTIAEAFVCWARKKGKSSKIIDGDDIRTTSHTHLGFSEANIKENNRLITALVLSLLGKYDYLIVSVITPYSESRIFSRQKLGRHYLEVFVKASLREVQRRDVKGLYAKAFNGEIDNFIGISSETPFETPSNPDIVLDTENNSVDQCIKEVVNFLESYAKE